MTQKFYLLIEWSRESPVPHSNKLWAEWGWPSHCVYAVTTRLFIRIGKWSKEWRWTKYSITRCIPHFCKEYTQMGCAQPYPQG